MRGISLTFGLAGLLSVANGIPTGGISDELRAPPSDSNRKLLKEVMAEVTTNAIEDFQASSFTRALEDFIVDARRAANLARRGGEFFDAQSAIDQYADTLFVAQYGAEELEKHKAAGKRTHKFEERDTSTTDSSTSSSASSDNGRGPYRDRFKYSSIPHEKLLRLLPSAPSPIPPPPVSVEKVLIPDEKETIQDQKRPRPGHHRRPVKPAQKPEDAEQTPQAVGNPFRLGPVLHTLEAAPSRIIARAAVEEAKTTLTTTTQILTQNATQSKFSGTSPIPAAVSPPFPILSGGSTFQTATRTKTNKPSKPTYHHPAHKPFKTPSPIDLPVFFPYPNPKPLPTFAVDDLPPHHDISIDIENDGEVDYEHNFNEGSDESSSTTVEGNNKKEKSEWLKENTEYHSKWGQEGTWRSEDLNTSNSDSDDGYYHPTWQHQETDNE